MDTKSVATQVLEQFESAFSEFLNPNTPQNQRNAIGRNKDDTMITQIKHS